MCCGGRADGATGALQQSGGRQSERSNLREDGGGFLEITAVHVASVQVGHLPVNPGHLSTPVRTELQGSPALVRIVQTDEHRSRIGFCLSENLPEQPRGWKILVFIEKYIDKFHFVVVNITDSMSAGVSERYNIAANASLSITILPDRYCNDHCKQYDCQANSNFPMSFPTVTHFCLRVTATHSSNF